MKAHRCVASAVVGATLVLGLAPAATAATRIGSPVVPGRLPALDLTGSARNGAATGTSRLIVKLRPGTTPQAAQLLLGGRHLRQREVLPLTGARLVDLPPGVDAGTESRLLQSDPRVLYAAPDRRLYAQGSPDPGLPELWGLHNVGQQSIDGVAGVRGVDVHALDAWQVAGRGKASVVVAVIDEGIDPAQPDLAGQLWTNTKEIPGNGIDDDHNGCVDDVHGCDVRTKTGTIYDPADVDDHGTHVAGTIAAAADNGIGIAGVAPGVKLMSVKFLGQDGGTDSDAIAAIAYAKANGASIINASWGGPSGGPAADKPLSDAIAASGLLFVAAAGNGNAQGVGQNIDTQPFAPASFPLPNVLSVAAVDNRGRLATFSNFGAKGVDVGAPGVGILSTIPPVVQGGVTYRYAYGDGTSMATPHVTGVAALVLSEHPGLTAVQLKQRILDSVVPLASLKGKTVSGGIVDAARAVAYPDLPVTRLAGANRFATAAAVAGEFPPDHPVAYVATSESFPDALTGAALAAKANAPVLLVTRSGVPQETRGALARLEPGKVVVLGGPAVVSDAVVTALAAYTRSGVVQRLAGANRYATAAAVAGVFPTGGTVAYVATGQDFPDALSGAALAGRDKAPVLLVDGATVPGATRTALARLKPQSIAVLGGAGAVSDQVLAALAPYATSGQVTRVAGATRYDTSLQVLARFAARRAVAYVATGTSYPDALTGAALAGAQGTPVVLVDPAGPSDAAVQALAVLKPYRIVLLGGAAALPAAVATRLGALPAG